MFWFLAEDGFQSSTKGEKFRRVVAVIWRYQQLYLENGTVPFMDSSESERLWEEIAALRERVAQLEARLPGALLEKSAAEPVVARGEGGVSFVPPARPSLESRIGSQVFNRVGIVAVLIGAAWFLKYAADREWLGPLLRVLIGFAAGLGLIGWSESFRRRGYPVFSFSLKAVGTGLLYLALWASFSLFHLVPYPVAFIGMVLVTAGNGWMCWVQRSEVLAAYAAIGGFLTPALLAPEHTSVFTLGSYLVLLNAGLFALLVPRRWPSLLVAAFTGTSSYLLTLAFQAPTLREEGQAGTALGLAMLFFAVFSIAAAFIGHPVAVGERGGAAPVPGTGSGADSGSGSGRVSGRIAVGIALGNAVLGAVELWRFVPENSFAAHWLPVFVALWFAGLLLAGRLRPAVQGTPEPVHAGLVIAFAALGIWTGLAGGGIVAGWALEAATMLVLTLRGRAGASERVLGSPVPAAALLGAAAVALVGFSVSGVLPKPALVLLNERSGLFALVIAVAILGVRLAARQHGRYREGRGERQWARMGAGSALLATALLLIAGVLEVHAYWEGAAGTAERFWDSAWAAMLGVGLLALGFALRWAFLRWQALGLLTLAVGKVFLVDTRSLSQGFRILSFLGLGVLLLCVSFIYQRDLLHLRGKEHEG